MCPDECPVSLPILKAEGRPSPRRAHWDCLGGPGKRKEAATLFSCVGPTLSFSGPGPTWACSPPGGTLPRSCPHRGLGCTADIYFRVCEWLCRGVPRPGARWDGETGSWLRWPCTLSLPRPWSGCSPDSSTLSPSPPPPAPAELDSSCKEETQPAEPLLATEPARPSLPSVPTHAAPSARSERQPLPEPWTPALSGLLERVTPALVLSAG